MPKPAKGRGVHHHLRIESGELLLIDESYNANPVSMAAALALLGRAKTGKGGRRIAVLGDMLELGKDGASLHAELFKAVDANKVDVVYAAGPLMAHLWEKTPEERRGASAKTSAELKDSLLGRASCRRRRHDQGLAGQPHGTAGRRHKRALCAD